MATAKRPETYITWGLGFRPAETGDRGIRELIAERRTVIQRDPDTHEARALEYHPGLRRKPDGSFGAPSLGLEWRPIGIFESNAEAEQRASSGK